MRCVIYSIMILTTCGYFFQPEAKVTPSFKPILTCRNHPEFIDISEDRSGTCGTVGACTEVTTINIPTNHSHVRFKWYITDSFKQLTGYKLEFWRDAPDDYPYHCITISFTQDNSNTGWYNTSSFVIDCTVHQPSTQFQLVSIDVIPLTINNTFLDSHQCNDVTVNVSFPETYITTATTTATTTTKTTSSIITKPDVNLREEPSGTDMVFVAIVIIAVIFCVSGATVAVWFIMQKIKYNNRNTSAQTHSGTSILTDMPPGQPGTPHITSFTPITHLPESFRALIMELNKET